MSLSDTHKRLFPDWPTTLPEPEELNAIPDISETKIVVKGKEYLMRNGEVMFIDKTIRKSIANIVSYLIDDEKQHYESLPEDERVGHIYFELLNVERWLGNNKPKVPT